MRLNKGLILNLEWSANSRDSNIVEPVCVSLEDRYGYKVVRDNIWMPYHKILKYKPECLFIASEIGADINYTACKIAKMLGIKVVTMDSEGQFFPADSALNLALQENSFWGWNYDRSIVWDLKLFWSEKKLSQLKQVIAGFDDMNIQISGGERV